MAEIEAELVAFSERSGEAISTVCRKALGYSSWLRRLRQKRERDADAIRILREYMEAHDGGERARAKARCGEDQAE